MLVSKAYRMNDIPKTIHGMEFCQNALLPELDTMNLFDIVNRVKAPVHFIQGKQDGVAPYQIAYKFYEYLQAEIKTFHSLNNAAHMPHYDLPEEFSRILYEIITK